MSSPDKSNGMAGHPNAVKVGGMRITQNKTHLKDKSTTPVPPVEEDALKVSTSPPKSAVAAVSGAPKKGNEDFPKEAVQSFHSKPIPTHDKGAPTKPMIIHQPKK